MKKKSKPRKRNDKKQPKGLADEDLWDHVVSSVDPLDARHKNLLSVDNQPGKTTIRQASSRKKAGSSPQIRQNEPVLGKKRSELPELSHGSTPGLDKSTATRLKKGRRPIDARLDLHGMTQAKAHPVLNDFLERCYLSGQRGVLVITGKGTKPDGSVGVLREAVPRWLNLPPNRARILAFSHATPKDGGEGALYVLLKRIR